MVIPSWHTGKLSIGETTLGNHLIPPAQPAQTESSAGWWGVQRCCSATPGQNQEHPLPSHLHGSAVDFCSFSCAALLLLGPVTVSVPFTNPAQHQPNKTSSLLPGYQVELLKQCSPECQNQQNGQVGGQRGMKSSGQVQRRWRKRRESGPFLLVQGQLGQLSCTTEPHPYSHFGRLPDLDMSRSVFDVNSCSRPLFCVSPKSQTESQITSWLRYFYHCLWAPQQ